MLMVVPSLIVAHAMGANHNQRSHTMNVTINQFNASHELTLEEQYEVIETVKFYQSHITTIEEAVAYCIEDEDALEDVSHIADFGM